MRWGLLHKQVGWLCFDPLWEARSLLLENILISGVRKTVPEGLRGVFVGLGHGCVVVKVPGLVA